MLFLVAASCAVQIGIWVWIWKGFRTAHEVELEADAESPPVSVIVAALDEAEDLPVLFNHLRRQDADNLEVILVDDRSSDRTPSIVETEASRWNRDGRAFATVTMSDDGTGHQGKKEALAAGIATARHERLLFTDADGRPDTRWASKIASAASLLPDGVFVGYGPIVKRPGWLNRFVRFETVHTATLAAAAVGQEKAWHAVGRNLSYPRALFDALGGFEAHAETLSGDDDLFVQHAARETDAPVRYLFDPDTFVPSEGPETWAQFVRQRRRHASAGKHYDKGVLAGLTVLHVSNLTLWIGALFLQFAGITPAGLGFLAGKLLVQRGALREAIKTFKAEADLNLAQPLLDPLMSLYQTFAAILGALPTPRRW